ncbi:MAG: AarF/ABC1/UbiB kinase family protein [Acidobacteriota bacterium]|nr:MAG: AarF/ABC1/UbiB kinase family protein [Acidobacteriota bacterium]
MFNAATKINSLKRAGDLGYLFLKYGRSDLFEKEEVVTALESERTLDVDRGGTGDDLAKDLEDLGGAFIKLGQFLSTRADLFKKEYLSALERLQDDVEPFAFEEVKRIFEEEFGVGPKKIFPEFEERPIAAASIGQVHRATTRDGRPVVVKVQRPGVGTAFRRDLEAFQAIAETIDSNTEFGRKYEITRIVRQLRKSLLQELDYSREASNLSLLGENLEEFRRLIVPEPVADLCTSRVLTMKYVGGKKITEVGKLGMIDVDGEKLASEFFEGYLKQMLVDGFFHADPHPGNVLITDSNQIVLLDLGLTGHLNEKFRDHLLNLLLAVSEGRGEDAAAYALKTGERKEDFDEKRFSSEVSDLVAAHKGTGVGSLKAGRIVLEITRISADCGFRLPMEFTLIAKTLLNMDKVVELLDPGFDPTLIIRKRAARIAAARMSDGLSPGAALSGALELKHLIEKTPERVDRILETIASNELKLNVDAIDERTLTVGFQKVANRIAMGLVLAALIIGASMLTNIDTDFKILGYPGLAFILFVLAAGSGIYLVWTIVRSDLQDRE